MNSNEEARQKFDYLMKKANATREQRKTFWDHIKEKVSEFPNKIPGILSSAVGSFLQTKATKMLNKHFG